MRRVRAAAPLLAASVLAGVAVLTVAHAGCADPGRYVVVPGGGYALVGGCLDPDDLVVPTPVSAAPARAADDAAPPRS